MKKIFKNKIFMATFVSDIISNFGDIVYYLALLNYLLLIPESKIALSIITMVEIIPIALHVITGYWADKTKNKTKSIIQTLVARIAIFLLVAVFMGFDPALWIVIVAAIIRSASSIIGNYESSLFLTIQKHIIDDEDREEFLGFSQSINQTFSIIFQSLGAILIGIMSYRALAVVNAGTFFCSLLIFLKILPKVLEKLPDKNVEIVSTENEKLQILNVKQMIVEIKDSFQYVFKVEELKNSVLLMPACKGFFVALMPITMLIIKEDPSFTIMNSQTTISILLALFTAGSIIGGFLTMNVLKRLPLIKAIKLELFCTVLLFIFFYFHQVYLVVLITFIIGILLGVINPKLSATIMNNLPEEKLGTIFGGLITFISFGDIIFRTLFSAIVVFLNTNQLILTFSAIFIIINIYAIFFSAKRVG